MPACDVILAEPEPLVMSNTGPNESHEHTSTAQPAMTACAAVANQPDRAAKPTASDPSDSHFDLQKIKVSPPLMTTPQSCLHSCCNWMCPIMTTRQSLRWSAAQEDRYQYNPDLDYDEDNKRRHQYDQSVPLRTHLVIPSLPLEGL